MQGKSLELAEILDTVDENNNVIGKASREECYRNGLLHRAVNIFIFNSKGQVFLHQRSDKKLKFPKYWDLSCSEHVKVGESFVEAAKRGMMEELGIEIPLQMRLQIHRIDSIDERKEYSDNELVVTFKGVYDGQMKFDPNEVAGGRFFNIDEVNDQIREGVIKVTPWFLLDWELFNLTK